LYANWPNPFNAQTQILYDLPYDAFVRLDIFDLTGQRIRSIVAGHQPAGTFRTSWDGTDDQGHKAGTGIYMIRLRAGVYRQVRKMLMLR
jgi:flagellar hook assembly protein FlgD